MPTEHSSHSMSLIDSFPSRKLFVIFLEKSIFATPVTKFSAFCGTCSFSNKPRIGANLTQITLCTILQFWSSITISANVCLALQNSRFNSRFQIEIVYVLVTRTSSVRPTCHPASFFLFCLVHHTYSQSTPHCNHTLTLYR